MGRYSQVLEFLFLFKIFLIGFIIYLFEIIVKPLFVKLVKNLIEVHIFRFRKISPGLMPPGSPGIFRRKSSTGDIPPLGSLATKSSGSDDLHSKMAATVQSTAPPGWPNTKDDYELKEVIGQCNFKSTLITII